MFRRRPRTLSIAFVGFGVRHFILVLHYPDLITMVDPNLNEADFSSPQHSPVENSPLIPEHN